MKSNADLEKRIEKSALILKNSEYPVAFTGAGISVESGIPPFRGEKGLWSQYDPQILNLHSFLEEPDLSWPVIKEIFYDFWNEAKPNPAHQSLAILQQNNLLNEIITQNIDALHQKAGSTHVWEYHGTLQTLTCVSCQHTYHWNAQKFGHSTPHCPKCHGLLKPDFIFFGEQIPEKVQRSSQEAILKSDLVLLIGTTGEVMPACILPYLAKENRATIIEINPNPSKYSSSITDIFLQGKAGEILPQILSKLNLTIQP